MKWNYIVSVSLTSMLISGCKTLPWHITPEESSEVKQVADIPFVVDQSGMEAGEQWWKQFDSEELNRLVEQALSNNLDIVSAWSRVEEAAAFANKTKADQSIDVDLSSSATTRVDHMKTDAGRTKDSSNSFSMGLSAAYDIDLWGRLNAATQARESAFRASQFDLSATQQLVSQKVAVAWISLKMNQAQLQLLKQQLETSIDRLELLKERQRKGLASRVDILQQQQQVAASESTLPPVKENVELQKHQIAVLLGLASSQAPAFTNDLLPELPQLPEIGIPSQLLEKRPDIQSAWQTLEGGQWNLAAAKADRLPSLRLTAGVSTTAPEVHDLFDNWAENLTASLVAPLIDGGRRKSEVERVEAQVDRAIAGYKSTVLNAVKEVDDALMSEKYQKEYLERLKNEHVYAEQTYDETLHRYRKGIDTYLAVMAALKTKQQAERKLIAIRGQILTTRIALYKALGGQVTPSNNKGATYDN